jgi:predicted Zn-dependent protease
MNAKTLMAAMLAASLLAPLAHAQPARDPSELKAEREARKAAKEAAKHSGEAPAMPTFPKATREEPKGTTPSSKMRPRLNKIITQFQSQDYAEAVAGSEAILADASATPFEKASAAQYAAFAAAEGDGNDKRAITYLKRAIDENALPNGVHFPLILELAKMYNNEGLFDDALATAKRFLDETKSEDPIAHSIMGNSYYQQDKYAEAITELKLAMGPDGKAEANVAAMLMQSYAAAERFPEAVALAESMSAKAPDDKKLQLMLANTYAEAGQPDKAVGVFNRLRAAGKLTESRDYEMGISILAKLKGHEAETQAFITEGMGKGILKPSDKLYGLLGQTYYNADNLPAAIDAWSKGAPLAANGELFLNLAILQNQEDHYADAKASAQQALAKGLKKPGKAWMVIAEAEQGLGNTAGIAAAYREAAKDPATRADAQKMLQKFGGK